MNLLETNRLMIRPFCDEDAAGMLEYLAHPRVNCFLDDRISTLEEAAAKVQKRKEDYSYVAVCLKESQQIIGELFQLKEEPDTYSIGWNFNKAFEGKGYARESAEAFLSYLFVEKAARRLYAYVEDDNVRSQALCERLGMRREGLFLEFISFTTYEDGTPKYENTYQYALLKKEWEQHHSL
ncbi:GNAT family N-acetyltransferase [Bacillus pumilus]|uniref:GNAT family N-acetyltransferase n=1 Tax=Bacillus TaxID=1386 RepID=UPI0007769E46|nr:GNAT family N-acetyltransferase [Bacillus pumilus]AMM97392.1 GCN5 family acetyltransferase [Bacillus pumilus]MDH3151473.1 GNAT family N-acetyltransferase [Bacillus pumilus]QLI78178.1 GNAT family N-acetyltransferase [Bacillus pumilus]